MRPDIDTTAVGPLTVEILEPINAGMKVEGLVEAFNVTNRANNLTRNVNFGSGAYPAKPSPTFNQITAVGDPRTFQLGVRFTF